MWLADLVLLSCTGLHLFISLSILTPVDSPLKKPLMKVTYKAVLGCNFWTGCPTLDVLAISSLVFFPDRYIFDGIVSLDTSFLKRT